MTEPSICLICGSNFTKAHEGRSSYCETCDDGPFCRMCLILRHKKLHEHGQFQNWIRKLLRGLRVSKCQCLACVEVIRR